MKATFVSAKKDKPAGISEKVIRLLEIYTLIAQKQFPSVATLMERFSVSKRTVFRYLEQINMIDALEFDRDKDGYKFTCGDRIKKLRLQDQEMITLFTAGEALSHLGPAFRASFQSLLDKMFVVSGKPGEFEKVPIIVKAQDAALDDRIQGYLMAISVAMKQRRSVDIVYRARGAKEARARTVDPYGLVFYEGVWILIGYCHLRKGLRSFALDRIADITERFRYFEPPKDFDLDKYVGSSWGVIHEEPVKVRLRFRADVAEFILRKDRWHPSERRKVLPSGEVELTFVVAGVREIKHWIYSWLPGVQVIEPAWLREQVRNDLTRSIQDHV